MQHQVIGLRRFALPAAVLFFWATPGHALPGQQLEKLLPDDVGSYDQYGMSVAIDGDFALVGSPGDDDLGISTGAVYVFARNGSNWVEQTKLYASDAADADFFGHSVAMSGDTNT